MIILFIHQNFPGQYRHIVRDYVSKKDARILFITQPNENVIPGVEKITYEPNLPTTLSCHPYLVDMDHAVRTGLAVREICRSLKARGVVPDIICGHNGWGEMLFVKDVFPNTPALAYFEFYYHAEDVDVGFDEEFDVDADPARLRIRNAVNLLGFDAVDWGNTPTKWQRSVHPPEFRSRLSVLHEGVDTNRLKPDPEAWLHLEDKKKRLSRSDEIVTYVARNLEPYRGFHIFMRATVEIQNRRPNAQIVIVGGDEVSYGNPVDGGLTHKEMMLEELGGRLDLDRIHFLGRIDYENYVRVLQISSAHIYLTYPFVLSWSFIEAMACGCAIIGSDTAPVMEVLQDRRNGLLTNFFSPGDIADHVDELLDDHALAAKLGAAARQTAIEGFDLYSRKLPQWRELIDDVANFRRPRLFLGDDRTEVQTPGPPLI